jgi:hypothetical protein
MCATGLSETHGYFQQEKKIVNSISLYFCLNPEPIYIHQRQQNSNKSAISSKGIELTSTRL